MARNKDVWLEGLGQQHVYIKRKQIERLQRYLTAGSFKIKTTISYKIIFAQSWCISIAAMI